MNIFLKKMLRFQENALLLHYYFSSLVFNKIKKIKRNKGINTMRIKIGSWVVFSVAGWAVLCCMTSFISPDRYMSLYGLVILSKETNRNDEALVLAQQIFDREIKISSSLQAIRNETWQLIENSQTEKVVPAPESRMNVKPLTTTQQTWRDKFSETVPKAFAPP
jgi:hypothetical protein